MERISRILRLGRRVLVGTTVAALSACLPTPSYPGPTPSPMPSFAPGSWQSEDWGATVTLRTDGTGSATHMPAWNDGVSGVSECYIDSATFEDYDFAWYLGTIGGTVQFTRDGSALGEEFLAWGRYDHDWSAIIYFSCLVDGPGSVLLGRVE
jgi:hypothetical protein